MLGSVRAEGGNPKSVWWNDQVKAAVKRKWDAWKEVLGAREEDARRKCLEVYKVGGPRTVWKEDEPRCEWK